MPHKQTQSGGQKHSSRKIAALYWNKFGASQGYRFMRRHSIICESSGLLIKMSTSNLTLCTPPFIQSTFTFLLLHLKCAQGREKQIKKAQPLAMSCSSSGGRGPQRSRQWPHVVLGTIYGRHTWRTGIHQALSCNGQTFNLNPLGPKGRILARDKLWQGQALEVRNH